MNKFQRHRQREINRQKLHAKLAEREARHEAGKRQGIALTGKAFNGIAPPKVNPKNLLKKKVVTLSILRRVFGV